MTPQEAYRQVRQGNFGCLVHPGHGGEVVFSPAWALAFRTAGQLVIGSLGVTPAAVRNQLHAAAEAEPLALACMDGALSAVLRFDVNELAEWCQLLGEVALTGSAPDAELGRGVAVGWWSLFSGDADQAIVTAHAVARESARMSAASISIEAVSLEALALLSLERVPEALAAARKASRMARTEGILQREYLANVILARARRFSGQPHAAARILSALWQVAPRSWRSWLGWEMLLCRGTPIEDAVDSLPFFDAGVYGSWLFRSAHEGNRQAFDATAQQLLEGLRGFTDLHQEASALVAALDPHSEVHTAPDRVGEWLSGRSRQVPAALQGLAIPQVDVHGEEAAAAFAVVRADRPGRLVLGTGLGLLMLEELGAPNRFSLSRGRTYTALAVLCLAPDRRLRDDELFHAVYGFSYVASKHQSTLRVLIHRMKTEVAEAARVVRDEGMVILELESLVVVPDPRCTPTTEELILRTIAAQGGKATLRQLALALSLSPRTVQRAMRTIVDEGACQVVGAGPETGYEFEDTTFHQPTLTRLRHRSSSDAQPPGAASITTVLAEHFLGR